MTIYEFTQALWRQKWLLFLGLLVLIPLSVALFLRSEPKYEATIQMAVMPAETESLAVGQLDMSKFVANSVLYAALLRSDITAPEIMEAEQVDLTGLNVRITSRDPFITVTATAATPEEAVTGALGSYSWLQQRLAEPPTLATVNLPSSSILDEEGKFTGVIEILVSRAFSEAGLGLWLDISIAEDPVATVSLADAALEDSVNVVADLWPGAPMTLVLEDAFEAELDSIVKALPAFPGPDTQSYNLVVRIDRGALSGEGLLSNRVAVSWEVAGGKAVDPIDVGLLLVSPNPIATETGTRRGPIVSAGAMAVGLFVLIAGVISIDTWTQAYRKDARHVRPVDEPPRDHEPGKDEPEEYEAEEETGDEPGPWQWQRPKAPSGGADAY